MQNVLELILHHQQCQNCGFYIASYLMHNAIILLIIVRTTGQLIDRPEHDNLRRSQVSPTLLLAI
jgi:hypothetical protein